MKLMTVIGIVLIGLGVVGLIYGTISYTSSKDVMDIGSVHVEVDQEKHIPISPIAGAAAVAVGLGLVLLDRRRRSGALAS